MDVRADRTTSAQVSATKRFRLRKLPRPALVLAAAVVAAAAIGVYLVRPKSDPKIAIAPQTPEQNVQMVTAVRASPREFVRAALVSGEVRPVDDVRVFASTTDVRIAEVLADVGDMVEEGQPMARLDAWVADAQILAAQAQYQEAKIEQVRAAEEFARIKPIADSGALSQEEVETRRAAAAAADARLAAQKAALEQVKARLQGGFIRAPAAGLVIERSAKVGELADQKALFRIAGGNRLEVAAAVSERDLLSLTAGQNATFRTGDGVIVAAVLRRPPVAIDPNTGVGEALFDLPLDVPVRTGMYLRGEVAVEKSVHFAAPQTAISYASIAPSVFVIADGKAQLRPVELGPKSGEFVAILSGIEEGEMIAASGGAFLLDGDAVRVVDPDASAISDPVIQDERR